MLVIDTPNVTFENAVKGASITPVNKGISLAQDSVRITGYYGHGYTYYSMGDDCKYDAKLLEVNNYNGYPSFTNPGSGTTSGSYWNATVVVNAAGFEAYDIIFENSFNQYQSDLAAADTIVKQSSAKEGSAPRAGLSAGDVTVQDKKYVERAAAMAIRTAADKTYFNHCAFIGRQDTLYGDPGSKEAYYNCDIYGGTDYIFGGMTAVFAKCNLIFNTSEDSNDVGYITAAQQKDAATRGYLMYNCKVTSTVPGENTASSYGSKAGYLGRPWAANTSEVVFYNTVVDATCYQHKASSASLIMPDGWLFNTQRHNRKERRVRHL
ncbi:pectinesterase family protein [Butyrivibrio sp. FCS014]|uniref:pectinesterase family protein n=1 Tax=Butyrivibrio sp. FCS014 TaxID=1408304 RepID=UPI0004666C51|nr:pectinesterase family protein [Butyrivibrio sp. FCS014]